MRATTSGEVPRTERASQFFVSSYFLEIQCNPKRSIFRQPTASNVIQSSPVLCISLSSFLFVVTMKTFCGAFYRLVFGSFSLPPSLPLPSISFPLALCRVRGQQGCCAFVCLLMDVAVYLLRLDVSSDLQTRRCFLIVL